MDFTTVVRAAWEEYDASRPISNITDISAKVSTNHVFKIDLPRNRFVIAKLSFFGKFEHFEEDHRIINVLANNLPSPFENLLARSLMKGERMFCYRFQDHGSDVWVVFYNPVKINKMLPKRLSELQIKLLGKQMARFHQTCTEIRHCLPPSSKTLHSDLENLLGLTIRGRFGFPRKYNRLIRKHCELFFQNYEQLNIDALPKIPVFVDWNIGNFSVTPRQHLYSRWDYDWFRMSSRMMDFYFMSRVCSDIGDRTVFSYNIGPLMEDRFLVFLKAYHKIFPLQREEVLFLKEAYRFFLLTYVIKYGRYFFNEYYAEKLQQEVLDQHLPALEDGFDVNGILNSLGL